MGAGDWVIATGQVKKMYAANPVPVQVVGPNGRVQWSEVFDYNPKIIRHRTAGASQILLNGPGNRPYVAGFSPERWSWKAYGPEPGEFFFQPMELNLARRYAGSIMIEPNVKKQKYAHTNKAWPFDRWQQLVNRLPQGSVIQCGPIGNQWLKGVQRVVTPTFRQAAVVTSFAKLLITTEGGLMHAAAATKTPSIILWSEFIEPSVTGYRDHINIRHAGPACGMRIPCETCSKSMLAISVDEVYEYIRSML